MADFIFRVETALNDDQKKQIAQAIQGAVLTELAKLDLGGHAKGSGASHHVASPPPTFAYLANIHWLGGMLAAELKAIEAASSSTLTVHATALSQAAGVKNA